MEQLDVWILHRGVPQIYRVNFIPGHFLMYKRLIPTYAVGGEERAELSVFSWGYPDLENHFSGTRSTGRKG